MKRYCCDGDCPPCVDPERNRLLRETPVADPALLDTLRSMGVDFAEVKEGDLTVAVRVTEDVYNDLEARAWARAQEE